MHPVYHEIKKMLAGYYPDAEASALAKMLLVEVLHFSTLELFGGKDKEVFKKCLIWAVTPSLAEYERVTTTHLIHPDNWVPFAPSGITRQDIAIWQYGKNCHPIADDSGKETTFNVNLVRDAKIIIEKMF